MPCPFITNSEKRVLTFNFRGSVILQPVGVIFQAALAFLDKLTICTLKTIFLFSELYHHFCCRQYPH